MAYRDTDVSITLAGQKINPLSDIANLGIQTTGNVVFVKHPSDADYRTVKESVGRAFLFDTIQAAIDSSKVRSGKNDFIIVCPRDDNTAWLPTGTPAAINLNKHNVHVVGLGATGAFGSASVVVELPGTAGTIGTMGLLQITGNNSGVTGFHFRGTAGTSQGGTLGDGGDGGLVTIGAGVTGAYLDNFKLEKTGVQYDAGTTGVTGTPTGDIVVGSAAKDIVISNGLMIGTGLKASASHGIDLQFNNENIVVKNVTMIYNKDAAASRFIDAAPGTANNALQLMAERNKFINTNGTLISSAFAGTMGVGFFSVMTENMVVRGTEVGTPGSTFVAPVYGTATVVKNPWIGIGTSALVSA